MPTTKDTKPATTTHTPGPWLVGNRYGAVHTEIAGRGYDRAVAYCWTHRADDRGDKVRYVPEPEGEANACLIAAAPDLLAALKAMVASYDGIRDTLTSPVVLEKLARADAAIAKAEGRAA